MPKRQNCNASIGSWGRKFLDLCHDVGLFIFNGRTLGDESGEFTCLVNWGRSTVNYIVGSLVIWQAATHLEVIIDDTRYCAMGRDSDHRLLRLHLSIDCNFVEAQCTVVTKKFLFRFKYDKSKAKK